MNDTSEGFGSITVLRGVNQRVGPWDAEVVLVSEEPPPCHLCEKPIGVEPGQVKQGAWMIHTASPICIECVRQYGPKYPGSES